MPIPCPIVAHHLWGSSSLDPALSMVSKIECVNGISDNSSLVAESVACETSHGKSGPLMSTTLSILAFRVLRKTSVKAVKHPLSQGNIFFFVDMS